MAGKKSAQSAASHSLDDVGETLVDMDTGRGAAVADERRAFSAARQSARDTLNIPGTDAWVKSSEALFDGASRLNAELLSFAARRWQDNARLWSSLAAGGGDWGNVLTRQQEFFSKAAEQYADEMQTVGRLVSETGRAAWEPMEELMRGLGTGVGGKR